MGTSNFSDEFKRDAVAQTTERGYPVSEVSKRLGVSAHSMNIQKSADNGSCIVIQLAEIQLLEGRTPHHFG